MSEYCFAQVDLLFLFDVMLGLLPGVQGFKICDPVFRGDGETAVLKAFQNGDRVALIHFAEASDGGGVCLGI